MSSKLQALSMSETKVVVVPWLDLPDYLTEKILERLPIFDYICFGAVCRHWRSIQTTHRLRHASALPPMVNIPWFIPHRPKRESVLCSVGLFSQNLRERRSQRRLRIPLSPRYLQYLRSEEEEATEGGGGGEGRVPVPASLSLPYGWVLFDDWPLPHYVHLGYKFTLLNPITRVQIQLPYLGSLYTDFKATMSPPPRCDLFVITSDKWGIKLHLYRQGNPYWTWVDYSNNDFNSGVLMAMVSAIHYKGMFYCLFLGKGLMVVDVDCPIEDGITGHYFEMDQSQLSTVGLSWEDFVEDRLEIFLVESNGKMLLVSNFFEYDPSSTTRTLERFELCEADLSNRRWVKVENLGDQSLFIYRNFVVSLLAADVGVKENCIYILDPPTDEPKPWSVFDFGTGKVANASLPCPPLPSTHLMFVPSAY